MMPSSAIALAIAGSGVPGGTMAAGRISALTVSAADGTPWRPLMCLAMSASVTMPVTWVISQTGSAWVPDCTSISSAWDTVVPGLHAGTSEGGRITSATTGSQAGRRDYHRPAAARYPSRSAGHGRPHLRLVTRLLPYPCGCDRCRPGTARPRRPACGRPTGAGRKKASGTRERKLGDKRDRRFRRNPPVGRRWEASDEKLGQQTGRGAARI